MTQQRFLVFDPPLIVHSDAIALEPVRRDPYGYVQIRWRDAESAAFHELSLPSPIAKELFVRLGEALRQVLAQP